MSLFSRALHQDIHRSVPNIERLFRTVVERYGQTDAAPEALYWAGVFKYRATNDRSALKATAQAFSER